MRKLLLTVSLIFWVYFTYSQNLTVDQSTYTVEELVTDVLIDSPCANVSNITYSTGTNFGTVNGIGFFEEPSGLFPFNEGLILAAGDAAQGAGPNPAGAVGTGGTGWPGDADLLTVIQAYEPTTTITYNASIIEFDFVPIASEISFRFLMASEEYDMAEFECTYSDVFAFFLTDQNGVTTNLAVMPDGVTPILVTTVHPDNGASCGGANAQYFSQYVAQGDPPIAYDGYTRSFTAFSNVNPGETYHIKLAIADARDSVWDSAVFLEAGSFNLGLDLGDDILVASGNAACDGDTVTLDTGSPSATHIWYFNGVEIVGETDSTLDVTVAGDYSVDVEFSASCQTSDSIIIEFVANPVANPPLDLLECSGGNSAMFDLTQNDVPILGGQNAADVLITYHETPGDADSGANPLASPYTNTSNPQTIHARIESTTNTDCYDTITFDIAVDNVIFDDPISDLVYCDDDADGFIAFTLTDVDNEIAASAGYNLADVTISYHESQADADIGANPLGSPYTNTSNPQIIYARLVDNNSTSCFATIEFNLIVNPIPDVQNTLLEQCDEDGTPDGLTEYNLTQAETDIMVSGDTTGVTFSYHLSQADAISNTNAQSPSPFNNTTNPQIIYVRIEDDVTGCFSIAEITLDVTATDVGDVSLEACDDDYDGITTFTLSDADAIILAPLPPGLTVAYYETANDAQLEINQLPDSYTNIVPGLQTIFIRVEDANNCYGISNMDLVVNSLPDNNSVNDAEFCSDTTDVASIDLTQFNAEVLGGQTAANFTITYHESQAEADAGSNPLASPYSNITNPQTIYVRIENNATGCFMTFITFEISVNPNPSLIVPTPLEVCDDNVPDGITSIDLSVKNDEIRGGNPNYAITYYLTQLDADSATNQLAIPYTNISNPQTIYARGQDINTGCYSTVSLDLVVEQAPIANTPTPLEYCDPDADGFGVFTLTDADLEITGGVPGVTVSYHETLSDAENNVNELLSPYNNIVEDTQTLYARVESATIATDCYTIVELVLIVNPEPQIELNLDALALCDDNADGFVQFDLTQSSTQVLNGLDPSLFTVSYYETQSNADAATNAIGVPTSYTNITNPQTVWIRVEDNATGCYKVTSLELIVHPLPLLVQPTPLELCDDEIADEITVFDLTVKDAEITAGNGSWSVSYYETDADAQADSNVIDPATAYTNTSVNGNAANPQTLYVRVTNTDTGCYDFTTLTLRVLPNPTPSLDPDDLELCDDTNTGDAQEVFDLTVNEAYIINGEAGVTATYHETLEDAEDGLNAIVDPTMYTNTSTPQTIWVRVTNDVTGCYTLVTFAIIVHPLPEDVALTDYIVCEIGTDGFYPFDLTSKDEEVLNGQDAAVFAVSYHATLADAQNGANALVSPYINLSNPQQIFVNITNTLTGCDIASMSFNIEVQEGAQANSDGEPILYELCDDNMETDGDPSNDSVQFDLTAMDALVLDGQDPLNYTVSYYATLEDAELGVNPLPSLYENIINPQVIYVRVDNDTTADSICYAVSDLTLQVNPIPVFDLEEDYILCVNTNGTEVIDQPVLDTGLSMADYSFVWSLNGVDLAGETGSSLAPTQGGSYSVTVTDNVTGCSSTDTAIVTESAPPVVTAVLSSLVFADENVIEATATGPGVYEYSLDDGPWQDSGIFTNVSSGEHIVRARDKNGCGVGFTTILVIDYPLFFTPNGDGYHDTWNIAGIATQPSAKIYIFDRFGKLLKQLSPTGQGWNGTYNGALMPSDDYWFMVEYNEPSDQSRKEFRAHFTLKR